MSQKQRGFSKPFVAALVAVILMLGLFALWRSWQPKLGGEMLRFAPSSTLALGMLDLSEHLQAKQIRQLLEEPKVGRKVKAVLGLRDQDLEAFESWFVPALMTATFPTEEGGLGTVLAIPVNNEAPVREFAEKTFQDQEWEDVSGVRCARLPQGNLLTIYEGHILISSEPRSMTAALAAWEGEDVWKSPEFQEAASKLHDRTPAAVAFVRLTDSASKEAPWFVGSAELQDHVLSTEGFLRVVPGSELAKVLVQESKMDAATLGLIPKSATSATAVNFAYLHEAFRVLEQSTEETLIDPRVQDLMEDLPGEVAWTTDLLDILPRLGFSIFQGGDAPELSGLVVVRTADAKASERLFESTAVKLVATEKDSIEGRLCRKSDHLILCTVNAPVDAVLLGFGPRARTVLEQSLKLGAEDSLLTHPKVAQVMKDSESQKLVMVDHADFHAPLAFVANTYGALASMFLDLPFELSTVVEYPYLKQALKSASYVQVESDGVRFRGYGAGNPLSVLGMLVIYGSLIDGL